ncbi:MAG: hypothetical protein AAFX79_06065 [Planctomycetota bacterium]
MLPSISRTVWAALLLAAALGLPGGSAAAQEGQRPLFIDDAESPTLSLVWIQKDGERIELTQTQPWGTKTDRQWLGYNVESFVAVGGTRIDLQQGHPLGSVVRVGFYKTDNKEPFFVDIKPGSVVEIHLSGVRFLEDAEPTVATAMQHLQYTLADVQSCGLDPSAIDQYNTSNPEDTLGDQVTERNARPGVLRLVAAGEPTERRRTLEPYEAGRRGRDGEPAERRGTIEFRRDADTGAIGFVAQIPYELFRHVRDPWHRADPGTFFEPYHFHIEFESLPTRALATPDGAAADR